MSSSTLCECGSDCSCARAPAPAHAPGYLHYYNSCLFSKQPLVYYAEVSNPYNSQYKGQKSNKPNCFVRAFRWYTQDHGRFKLTSGGENKEVGFAAWLDQKYEQYLRESQLTGTSKSEVSSAGEPLTTNQEGATPLSGKRDQRSSKSPLKKRRGSSKSPEEEYSRADHIDNCKCKPSFQIILRPKSMSRLPSETCPRKGQAMYCTSSKVTVVSSETQLTTHTYSKIRGIVIQEIPMRENNGAKSENNLNDTKPTMKANTSNSEHTYVLEENMPSKGETSKIKDNCECPVEPKDSARAKTTDAKTQYDPSMNIKEEEKPIDNITTSRVTTKCSLCIDKSSNQPRPEPTMNTHVCEGHNEIDTREQSKPKPISISTVGEKPQCCQKSVRDPGTHISQFLGAVQTSDYAINLGNCTCDCPLLVRIVNARQ